MFIISILIAPSHNILYANTIDYDAEAVFLLETNTGQVVYENNSEEPMAPASITKIMTLVLALEALEEEELDLEEKVTISENARIPFDGTQSVMGFDRVGQEVKLEDILTGIAVVSANDGCLALAEHMHGSVNSFVNAMNEKADEIGLDNTSFANPHGLDDPDQYMSAKDVAFLSKYAINNTPKILELESIPEFTFNDITQSNRNLLLPDKRYEYEGADGLKTGRTQDSGYSFVGTAERGDMRLVAVVMKAPDEPTRFENAKNLLDYGFDNYQKHNIYEQGSEIGEAPVVEGTERFVSLNTSKDLSVISKADDTSDFEENLVHKEDIQAPVNKGEILGELEIYEDDSLIGSVDLEAAEDIDELGFFGKIFRGISNFFSGIWNTVTEFISNLF